MNRSVCLVWWILGEARNIACPQHFGLRPLKTPADQKLFEVGGHSNRGTVAIQQEGLEERTPKHV